MKNNNKFRQQYFSVSRPLLSLSLAFLLLFLCLPGAAGAFAVNGSYAVTAGSQLQLPHAAELTWNLSPAAGIDSGTMDASGLYTAPSRVPPAGNIEAVGTAADGTAVRASINIVPTQADGSFAEIGLTSFPVENSLIGDLNGDGIDDLWLNGPYLNYSGISVRFGQGDGTFGAIVNYPADLVFWGLSFRKSVLADMDRDGLADIVSLSDDNLLFFCTKKLGEIKAFSILSYFCTFCKEFDTTSGKRFNRKLVYFF